MIELLCTDYNKKATSIHYYFGNAVLGIPAVPAPSGTSFGPCGCLLYFSSICVMLNGKKDKEAVEEMKCPYCGNEMESGFLTSDARCTALRRKKHDM